MPGFSLYIVPFLKNEVDFSLSIYTPNLAPSFVKNKVIWGYAPSHKELMVSS